MAYRKHKTHSQKVLRFESLESRLLLSVTSPIEIEQTASSAAYIASAESYDQPSFVVDYPPELFSTNSTSTESVLSAASSNYTLGSQLIKNDMIYFSYALPEGGTQKVYLRINEVYNTSATSVNVSLRTNSDMGVVREISYYKTATVRYDNNTITIEYLNSAAGYHTNLANQTTYLPDDYFTIKINKSTNVVTFSATSYGSYNSSCSYGQWTGNVLKYDNADLIAAGGGTVSLDKSNLNIKSIRVQNGDNILPSFFDFKIIFFATTSKSVSAQRILLGEESYFYKIPINGTVTVNSPSLDISDLNPGIYYVGWEIQIINSGHMEKNYNNNVAFSSTPISVTNSSSPTNSDQYESNNTLNTAYNLGTISGTKTISSNIANTTVKDEDWFQFTISSTGSSTSNVKLLYTHNYANCDLDLKLYNSVGNLLGSSAYTTGTEVISLSGKSAGTYYLKVFNYNSNTSVCPYTLTISHTATTTTTNNSNLQALNGGRLSPSSVIQGETIIITTGNIKNIGNTTSSTAVVKFYASTDSNITTTDTCLGQVSLTSLQENASVMASLTASTAQLSTGRYYIGWIVTSSNDSETSNNTAICSTCLTVTSDNPSSPTNSDPYESNNTLNTAYNLGTISGTKTISSNISNTIADDEDWFKFTIPSTGASTSKVTLSYTHNSNCDLDLELYNSTGSKIGSSEKTTGTEEISLSEKSAGIYYVKVHNFKNNTSTSPYTLSISHTAATTTTNNSNLQALDGGTLSLSSVIQGETIKITTGNIKNIGNTTSSTAVVKFYASTDSNITTADTCLGQVSLAELRKNAAKAVSLSTSTAQLGCGTYYIGWIVTSSNDSDTSNNTAICGTRLTVVSANPNLQALNGGRLSPSSVIQGETIKITTGNIKNIGNTTSSTAVVKFYASTDSNITTADTCLGQVSLVALRKNAAKAVSLSTSTAQLGCGTYYIGWIVTSSNDSDTSNNTAICGTRLTVVSANPNLQALNGGRLSPSSVIQGETIKITTGNIKNIGNTTSSTAVVKFYASTDSNITTADTCLGQVSLAELRKNAAKAVSLSTSTAQLGCGTYYIGWIVTSSNDSDTSNNTAICGTRLTVVSANPNLQALNGGRLSPSSVIQGETIKITTGNIKNIGNTTSSTAVVKFYASTDSNITTADTCLGQVSLAELRKNAAKAVSLSTSTAQLSSGTYYIGWIVTSSNDSDTSNNTAICGSRLTVTSANPSSATNSDQYESNNTIINAYNLGTISGTKTISSNIANTAVADVDWFKFTISSTGTSTSKVKLSYSHNSNCDLDMELYNSTGSIINSSLKTTGTEELSLSGMSAGSYYVKVNNYRNSTSTNPYTLSISHTSGTTTPTTTNRSKLPTPTLTLYSGYQHISVSFSASTKTDVYLISYRVQGSSSWSNEYIRIKSGWTGGGLYRIENLQVGKTYEVRVMVCAKLDSSYSNSDYSVTQKKAVLTQPSYSNFSSNSTFVDANILRNSYYINW